MLCEKSLLANRSGYFRYLQQLMIYTFSDVD